MPAKQWAVIGRRNPTEECQQLPVGQRICCISCRWRGSWSPSRWPWWDTPAEREGSWHVTKTTTVSDIRQYAHQVLMNACRQETIWGGQDRALTGLFNTWKTWLEAVCWWALTGTCRGNLIEVRWSSSWTISIGNHRGNYPRIRPVRIPRHFSLKVREILEFVKGILGCPKCKLWEYKTMADLTLRCNTTSAILWVDTTDAHFLRTLLSTDWLKAKETLADHNTARPLCLLFWNHVHNRRFVFYHTLFTYSLAK